MIDDLKSDCIAVIYSIGSAICNHSSSRYMLHCQRPHDLLRCTRSASIIADNQQSRGHAVLHGAVHRACMQAFIGYVQSESLEVYT